jgi:hypothetical protein
MLANNRTPLQVVNTPIKIIKVVLATQYGQRVIRPADETAELFCEFNNTKTLTPRMVEIIKKLGYTVEVVPTEPKEL